MAVISDLLITALLQTEFISQTTTDFAGQRSAPLSTLRWPQAARVQCDSRFLRNPAREEPANGSLIFLQISPLNSERGTNFMSSGASVLTLITSPTFTRAVLEKGPNKLFFLT